MVGVIEADRLRMLVGEARAEGRMAVGERFGALELVKRGEIRTVLVAGRRLVPDTEARRLLAEAA